MIKKVLLTILFMVIFMAPKAQCQEATAELKLDEFKKIVIVQNGRRKPLETYAKSLLLRLSGRSKLKDMSAIEWLAEIIFSPENTYEKKVFLINDPEVLEAIGVEPDKHRRYSFDDLRVGLKKLYDYAAKAYEKEEKKRSDLDKEFLRVFINFHNLVKIMESFQFFHQHEDFSTENTETQKHLFLEGNGHSLFDIIERSGRLETALSKMQGLNPQRMSRLQTDLLRLSVNLYKWIENHKSYDQAAGPQEKFAIIPKFNQEKVDFDWHDPWEQLLDSESSDKDETYSLKDIYFAYKNKKQGVFDNRIKEFNKTIEAKHKKYSKKLPHTQVEIFYNKLNPFTNCKFLYGFAFLFCMLASLTLTGIFNKLAFGLNSIAFLVHLAGILCRIVILERPPVSNLFETFVFVGWVCVLLGMIMAVIDKKSNLGMILASLSGLIMLLISGKFAAEGDTLEVLQAVLNSNFWLATHVICVTIGYAGTFAAGLVGHIYLIQRMMNKDVEKLHSMIYGILGFGICFSFLGTMLGGIWADQSWGRFWGWDPKENGALLIVLWTAILFHARLSGMIKKDGLAIGSVIGSMIVMISWFGINLLGVGLHSYGFTSGIATGLFSYLGFEVLFIALSLTVLKLKSN